MRSDRRILPAILLVVALLSSMFYLLQRDGENEELSGEAKDAQLGDELSRGQAKIPSATFSKKAKQQKSNAEKTRAFADDTPLNFGSQIQSGDCIATFRLIDKKGAPLIAETLSYTSLWRKLGDYWVQEHAEFDKENSRVICAGSFGTGLEPGEYDLGVACRAYGSVWHRFKIAAGQNITGEIKLPNWRRFIKLRYVDEDGKPLAKLLNKPIYNRPLTRLPRIERKTPTRVLAPPPVYVDPSKQSFNDVIGLGGSGGGRMSSRTGRRRYLSQATDEGYWHVEVFAGGLGTLSQNFSKRRDGRSAIHIRGTFEGEEWDDYEVKVIYDDGQQAKLKRYVVENPENPGDRNILLNKPQEQPLPTDRKPSARYPRAIFAVNSSVEVEPFIHDLSNDSFFEANGILRDRKPQKVRGIWYADIFRDNGLQFTYSFNDGALLRSDVFSRLLQFNEGSENPYLVKLNDTVAANRTNIETAMPTATSRAWARGLKVGWHLPRKDRFPLRVNKALGNRFSVRTALALTNQEDTPQLCDLELTFMGEGRTRNADFTIRLDEAQRQSLEDGSLTLRPEAKGLILRAVDIDGAGLPWVEASLVPISRLHTAVAIRKRMNKWRKENRKDRHFTNKSVEIQVPGTTSPAAEPEETAETDEVTRITDLVDSFSDNDLREILKDGLYEEFQTDEERRFFAKNYTWYNTHRRLKSDRRGYLIDWKQGIVPGERYAVFLWSKSRDHLVADKMVLFTAQEGLCDLGAVLMPDYE